MNENVFICFQDATMATMRTFLPTPTKFGSRKVEFWNGRSAKPEPGKHRGKASAGSLQVRYKIHS